MFKKLGMIIGIAILLQGCVSFGNKRVIQEDLTDDLIGLSKIEVRELLETPDYVDGDTWKYYYYRGILSPEGIKKGGHTLTLRFSKDGVVEDSNVKIKFSDRKLNKTHFEE
jgi:hypothetical protein